DPLARALCWTAAIDQLRDAELAARDYVRLVVNNIHTETDPGAVQQLLGGAAQAITLYGDPANRDAARLQLAMRALESLKAADPVADRDRRTVRSNRAHRAAPTPVRRVDRADVEQPPGRGRGDVRRWDVPPRPHGPRPHHRDRRVPRGPQGRGTAGSPLPDRE